MQIRFLKIAREELKDGVRYYELEFTDLGNKFKRDGKKGIHRISELPKASSIEHAEIRKYLLHRFPCKLLYSIENDCILIIAVAHQHRKPEYRIKRIKKRGNDF